MGALIRFVNAFIDGVVNGVVEVGGPKEPPKKQPYYPQNSIEMSIYTIANTAVNSSSSFTKDGSAQRIFEIIFANWDNISETTRSYAIQQLGRIQNSSNSSFTRDTINDLITKIAIGRPKKSD